MSKENKKIISIKVQPDTYDMLDKERTTEKGKVTFDAIIKYLFKNVKRK